MRRPTRPWSQRKLSGIATLEEESGWQTLLQAPQDFTTHVCEDLPYVLHCAARRPAITRLQSEFVEEFGLVFLYFRTRRAGGHKVYQMLIRQALDHQRVVTGLRGPGKLRAFDRGETELRERGFGTREALLLGPARFGPVGGDTGARRQRPRMPVSYTHLTLPTKR